VFPTTVWTVVRDAGRNDARALEEVAAAYRRPVLDFIRAKGVTGHDAEDCCQEVFVRLLRSGVLARADASKGRFRGLLCTITVRMIIDRRRRRSPPEPVADLEPAASEPEFDRAWALHLVERALDALAEESPRWHAVLEGHLRGEKQATNRLWIARGKLKALLRRQVALTCRSPGEIEDELAALAPYLGPKKS